MAWQRPGRHDVWMCEDASDKSDLSSKHSAKHNVKAFSQVRCCTFASELTKNNVWTIHNSEILDVIQSARERKFCRMETLPGMLTIRKKSQLYIMAGTQDPRRSVHEPQKQYNDEDIHNVEALSFVCLLQR